MKKIKTPIYVRYEFSNESGQPEGGDIFALASMKKMQEMTAEILAVAHGDNVSVNLTIGEKLPFFGYLKNKGMTRKDIDQEMAEEDFESPATPSKPAKKSAKKKTAKAKK